jgi:hypothetical protein
METAAMGHGVCCTAKIGSSVFLVFTALGIAWYCYCFSKNQQK